MYEAVMASPGYGGGGILTPHGMMLEKASEAVQQKKLTKKQIREQQERSWRYEALQSAMNLLHSQHVHTKEPRDDLMFFTTEIYNWLSTGKFTEPSKWR